MCVCDTTSSHDVPPRLTWYAQPRAKYQGLTLSKRGGIRSPKVQDQVISWPRVGGTRAATSLVHVLEPNTRVDRWLVRVQVSVQTSISKYKYKYQYKQPSQAKHKHENSRVWFVAATRQRMIRRPATSQIRRHKNKVCTIETAGRRGLICEHVHYGSQAQLHLKTYI